MIPWRLCLKIYACAALTATDSSPALSMSASIPSAADTRITSSTAPIMCRCMASAAVALRSLAYRAAWYVSTAETDPSEVSARDVDSACSAAKAAAGETAVFACESLVQVLGGIGMTWDHVAHRFYKRALGNRAYGGGPAYHRAVVAAALLDG